MTDPSGVPVELDSDALDDAPFDPNAVRARSVPRTRARSSEGATVAAVTRELNRRPGVRVEKVQGTSAQGRGRPDLNGVILLPRLGIGRLFKIEMKRPGESGPTPAQTAQLLWWQEAGALVGWATTFTEVDEILSRAPDAGHRWQAGDGPGAPLTE